jgi:hypothetical protein
MAETPWLDLPYRKLSRQNVWDEAARQDLTLRRLMGLYYQHDRERAVHLSLSWCVNREQPEELFGKARVDQFVGDLTKYLEGERVRLTVTGGVDPRSLDELRGLKEERRGKDLQQQPPRRDPGSSNPRKRKRGGNRKPKDARRRERRQRKTSTAAPPPLAPSILYEDRAGNEFRFTAAGVELVRAAKPPAKRSKKRARRSPSTSSSSSSASSSSPSSSSSSSSSSLSGSVVSRASFVSITSIASSYCDRILNITPSPSASSSSSEDDDLPRAESSAPIEGGGAVPAAEAASPSPELEIIYSKPPEQVDDDRWTKAFRRALPAEEEREPRL